MSKKQKDILINPTWSQMIERDPLISFSWYISGRKNVLLKIADEIKKNLEEGFTGSGFDGRFIDRAEALLWLWVLGAYEVIRTMSQARECFADRLHDDLASLKKILENARMPAAKMEKRGKKIPVSSDRSPASFDYEAKDLLIGDPEDEDMISGRLLLQQFEDFIAEIMPEDIIQRHEDSY